MLFTLNQSILWELRDKINLKNLQFWPESLGAILIIQRGLFAKSCTDFQRVKFHVIASWSVNEVRKGVIVGRNCRDSSKLSTKRTSSDHIDRAGSTPREIGWGYKVQPTFKNPYPIYDQTLRFSPPCLWSNQKLHTLFKAWPLHQHPFFKRGC